MFVTPQTLQHCSNIISSSVAVAFKTKMTDYVFMALAPLIAFVPLLILMRRNAPKIYDRAIIHMTALWYKEVLDVVPKNSKVLDIGIGTATALLENLGTVRGKNLTIDGVDYENSYVNAANENISARDATDSVKVHCESIFLLVR